MVEEGYDFAIRYGALAESALIARKLANRKLVCAAAPAYLERHGEPKEPQDLRRHSCIAANNNIWLFEDPESQKRISVRVGGRLKTNYMPLMRLAAEKGFGVAYTPIENLQTLIDAGKLHRILEGFEDTSRSQWIIYPERRLMPRRVRGAIEYLLDALAAERR